MSSSALALPELAGIRVHGTTRATFILRAALAAGSVYGLAAVSPFVGQAVGQAGGGDLDVLNFALTLEYLEAGFYAEALARTKGLDAGTLALARRLGEDEAAHVDVLATTIRKLGGTPARRPRVDFGDAFSSPSVFLRTANTFEDTGVSAYNGAAPQILNRDVLAAAGSIVQVEARHAALIRQARERDPAPRALDEPSSMAAVQAAVRPYLA